MKRLWWLRPTRRGRFFAYHNDCRLRNSSVLGNWPGYFTYTECTESRKHYSFKHDHERLYEDTGWPLTPPSYR